MSDVRTTPGKRESYTHRRQFLRGAGLAVGIPFLSSLATPRGARGDVFAAPRRRFIEVLTFHGGVSGDNFFPRSEGLPGTATLFPRHDIRFGPLVSRREGSNVVISKAVQAPQDELTERMLGQINMYRGFTVSFRTDHNMGTHLGNFAAGGSAFKDEDPRPTIDQVLAWSKTFYSDTAGIRERLLLVGDRTFSPNLSYRYASPETKSGKIVAENATRDLVGTFNKLFKGFDPKAVAKPQVNEKPMVDLVLEDYKRLRDGSQRLSSTDRQRLSDHMDMLGEVERKVSQVSKAVACGNLPASAPLPEAPAEAMALWVDVIASAITCGLTRIACLNSTFPIVSNWRGYRGDEGSWHQGVAHTGNQELLSENSRNVFAKMTLALARKLDVEESGGRTFLDNSLIFQTNECGEQSHEGTDFPILTMGSAAGFFKTGQFVDLRRMAQDARWVLFGRTLGFTGPLYNQMLSIVLQSMGLPRSEFERNGQQGYGRIRVGEGYEGRLVPEAFSQASRMIDAVKA